MDMEGSYRNPNSCYCSESCLEGLRGTRENLETTVGHQFGNGDLSNTKHWTGTPPTDRHTDRDRVRSILLNAATLEGNI